MSKKNGGGCFCGEIRYELTGDPALQLFCFCSDCLSMSGTDGFAGYMVPEAHFKHIKGSPTKFEKKSKEGRTVVRNFCGTCGSSLWGETEFGLISLAAGSLDEPSLFKPTHKVFAQDAPEWARVPAHLEDM